MKFTRQREIQQIFIEAGKSPNAVMELARLSELETLLIAEFSDKLNSIWMIGAKIDNLRKELKHGNN